MVTTEHAAFTRGALGKSAGRVWDYLLCTAPQGGATVDQIKRATGVSSNTVRSQLKRMTEHELLVKHGQRGARWTVNPEADLDRVAEEYGQADYEERVAERFHRERLGRAEQLRQWSVEAESEQSAPADSCLEDFDRRVLEELAS